MRDNRRAQRIAAMATILSGTAFQFGGCGNAVGFLRDFNPCGSVLACDPVTFRFLTSGYQGPGVDVEVDPSCTFPPFCPGDPFVTTQDG